MAVSPVAGQTNHNENAASATTIATTLNNVKAGNLVACFVFCINTSTVTSVKDDLGNSAVRSISFNWAADGAFMEHWIFQNCAGGNRTYTVTYSPAATFRTVHVVEISGADPSAKVFDATSSTSGTSTTPTATSVTPKWDGSLVFATAASVTTAAPAAAAPYTSLVTEAVNFTTTESQTLTPAAATAAGWTQSTSRGWGAIATVILPDMSSGYIGPTRGAPNAGPRDSRGFLKTAQWWNYSAPVTSAPITIVPGIGSLVLDGFAPAIGVPVTVVPSTGSLVLSGLAPTFPTNLLPGFGQLTLTGFGPTIGVPVTVVPGFGALVLTGFSPTFPRTIVPGFGQLTLTGFAPTFPQTLLPGFGALVLNGFAPSFSFVAGSFTLQPGVGALSLTGFAPVLGLPKTIVPGIGALTLSGFAPVIGVPVTLRPGVGLLTLTGFDPSFSFTVQQLARAIAHSDGTDVILVVSVASGTLMQNSGIVSIVAIDSRTIQLITGNSGVASIDSDG